MTAKQDKASTSWAISQSISLGAGKGAFGSSTIGLTLFDVQSQIYIPLTLKGGSVGAGLSSSFTLSTFSPSFFTTDPLWARDFTGKVTIATAEMTIGIGGGLTYLTFWGVKHSPSWLDIGGLGVGLSAGIGAGIWHCQVNIDDAWKNGGCLIAPGGDPLCGGESKMGGESPAYQSTY